MKWIGITGGIGSGKSTVSRILKQKGQPLVDADEIVQKLLDQDLALLNEMSVNFGTDIFKEPGNLRTLDRKKLANKVFKKPMDLERLESLIHPRVQKIVSEFKMKCLADGVALAFYDVPLLFEKNLSDQFDEIWVVACDETQQIDRIKKRNHWSDEEIAQRLKNQIPLRDKIPKATRVIWNRGTEEDLKLEVQKLLTQV